MKCGQIATKALTAGDEVLIRLLETFDVIDSERFTLTGGDQDAPAAPGATPSPRVLAAPTGGGSSGNTLAGPT